MTIYKKGQGFWTRVLTAIGAGTLMLAGMAWINAHLGTITDAQTRTIVRLSIVIGVVLIGGGVLWYLLNKPRIADFMIATEAEMRKVNWPSRREIIGSTWVVICGTFLIAALLGIINFVFAYLFSQAGILQTN